MKNKTKVVVALASLLAVTGGIGAYSTFAWFSTSNTATVNVNSLQVYNRGNFTMEFLRNTRTPAKDGSNADTTVGLTLPTASDSGKPSTYSVTGSINNALDISGDGINFYRPKWKSGLAGSEVANQTSGDHYETITNTVTSSTAYDFKYITFDIKFSNNGSTALNLFLDKGSQVVKASEATKDDKAASSTRVAFAAGSNIVSTWQYVQSTANADSTTFPAATGKATGYGYLKAETAGVAYKGNTTGDDATTGLTLTEIDSAKFIGVGDISTAYVNGASTTDPRYLGTIPAGDGTNAGTYTLTISIWIEGTLKTAIDDIIGGKVNTSMVFTGVTANA